MCDLLAVAPGSPAGPVTWARSPARSLPPHPVYDLLPAFHTGRAGDGGSTNTAPGLWLASCPWGGFPSPSLPVGPRSSSSFSEGLTAFYLLHFTRLHRYTAICHPLHYDLIMSWQLYGQMTLGSLGPGFLLSLPLTILICHLLFCGHHEIYHFFCDMPAVSRVACADARMHKAALCAICAAPAVVPFLLTCLS